VAARKMGNHHALRVIAPTIWLRLCRAVMYRPKSRVYFTGSALRTASASARKASTSALPYLSRALP
jgi:hypothetical protein